MTLWDFVFPNSKKIIIWGAGKRGQYWLDFLCKLGKKVELLCDKNDNVKRLYNNGDMYDVLQPQKCDFTGKIVLISPINNVDEIVEEAISYGIQMDNIIVGNHLYFFPHEEDLDVNINWTMPGHFYSPYPSITDVREKYKSLIDLEKNSYDKDDIDLNELFQIDLLKKMNECYSSRPKWFGIDYSGEYIFRYRIGNSAFGMSDAFILHFMLRYLRPKRYFEVGSGFSSAVVLDTNKFYLNNTIELKFIEPYPDTLKSILKQEDKIELLPKNLQDVSLEEFKKLQDGDILFIDSTHVSKFNSDVNYLFFHILPMLNRGVIVHFHDIFFPWEYPEEWLEQRRGWNELYLLRAFLQGNQEWKIIFFNQFMAQRHRELYCKEWRNVDDLGGGSFWMRKR